ncbi:phosphate ABC transporter substrate-binding protein [Paenibacillus sp. J2TS4]|uniref:phosphate ABC transporter substrate-binding protein n=1 Tax=Paenibacillus sp. J2TS4 TaxID=2807194 RepID=UPI001B1FB612|nr:phosphate ABC transporter substrate-binding protein [Paenibacillus sp. J2TS4]GIP33744.1 phosphate-binding protein [Paenibacillus sp. J2TS4]
MQRKNLSFILLAIALSSLLILAACGSNNSGSNNGSGGSTPAASETNKPNDKEPKNDSKKDKEISGSIVALGSSAMQPLVEEAAAQFMEKNSKAQVQVQGGGSGTGLSQVASGGADIGNSDIFAEEKSDVDASQLVDHKIAVVGMGAVANPNVGVDNLTKQQLIDIFTGKIKNWKDVGGADQEIVLVNRPQSSGTRATFFTFALDKNEESEGITEDSSGTVKKIVGETPGAIGYLAFSYFDETVKPISIDGVAPTSENVYNNSFPVWAYMHMYTKGEPEGVAKAFLDYILSPEIQDSQIEGKDSLIEELGYIPVSKMKVDRSADGAISNK